MPGNIAVKGQQFVLTIYHSDSRSTQSPTYIHCLFDKGYYDFPLTYILFIHSTFTVQNAVEKVK